MISSLPRSEFECHVVVPDEPPLRADLAAAGAHVHIVPMRRITTSGGLGYWLAYALAWPGTVLRIARLVRRLDIDIVHSNSLHSWYGWAAARMTRKPHVWSAREIVVQSNAALNLERFLLRRFATSVVSISHAVGRQLDVGDEWIFTEGVDTSRFRPVRTNTFRTKHGIAPDAFVFGAAGRIDTWKGFDVLFDAWALANLDAELVIAGGSVRGKERFARDLEGRAKAMRGVRFVGPLDDMSTFYPDLDVFVLPSTSPEPLGLVLLEALACGTPVIATDHGGPPEIVTGDPGRGRLVAPNDAEALARAMGRFRTGSQPAERTSLIGEQPALWPSVFRDAMRR